MTTKQQNQAACRLGDELRAKKIACSVGYEHGTDSNVLHVYLTFKKDLSKVPLTWDSWQIKPHHTGNLLPA